MGDIGFGIYILSSLLHFNRADSCMEKFGSVQSCCKYNWNGFLLKLYFL